MLGSAAAKKDIPPCMVQFSHIHRFRDHAEPVDSVAKIIPGEYYVTTNNEMISTVLGSCIAVCVYDNVARMGGMNHFMLPEGSGSASGGTGVGSQTRFGNHAMELLINDLLANGAERSRLKVKIFGGAKIMEGGANIGAKNIEFVRRFIGVEGYQCEAEDTGLNCPRFVKFYPLEGRVKVKQLPRTSCAEIAAQEKRECAKQSKPAQDSGGLELF